jgi:hypothetical protein
MHVFFDRISAEHSLEIEQLSRLAFELRENHAAVLEAHGATDEAALLAAIAAGEAAEHPTYQHYLAARVLADTRESVRATLKNIATGAEAPGHLHLELALALEEHFGEHLEGAVDVRQDALLGRFQNGVSLEVRYAAVDAYALEWTWGEARFILDTAPLHPQLGTFPNHLQDAAGQVVNDPLTRCGAVPWDNLRVVVAAILTDPLLENQGMP